MVDRKTRYETIKANALYGKGINSFTVIEKEIVEKFIRDHNQDVQSTWLIAVRKLFVNDPNKPKNWTLIYEVLSILA